MYYVIAMICQKRALATAATLRASLPLQQPAHHHGQFHRRCIFALPHAKISFNTENRFATITATRATTKLATATTIASTTTAATAAAADAAAGQHRPHRCHQENPLLQNKSGAMIDRSEGIARLVSPGSKRLLLRPPGWGVSTALRDLKILLEGGPLAREKFHAKTWIGSQRKVLLRQPRTPVLLIDGTRPFEEIKCEILDAVSDNPASTTAATATFATTTTTTTTSSSSSSSSNSSSYSNQQHEEKDGIVVAMQAGLRAMAAKEGRRLALLIDAYDQSDAPEAMSELITMAAQLLASRDTLGMLLVTGTIYHPLHTAAAAAAAASTEPKAGGTLESNATPWVQLLSDITLDMQHNGTVGRVSSSIGSGINTHDATGKAEAGMERVDRGTSVGATSAAVDEERNDDKIGERVLRRAPTRYMWSDDLAKPVQVKDEPIDRLQDAKLLPSQSVGGGGSGSGSGVEDNLSSIADTSNARTQSIDSDPFAMFLGNTAGSGEGYWFGGFCANGSRELVWPMSSDRSGDGGGVLAKPLLPQPLFNVALGPHLLPLSSRSHLASLVEAMTRYCPMERYIMGGGGSSSIGGNDNSTVTSNNTMAESSTHAEVVDSATALLPTRLMHAGLLTLGARSLLFHEFHSYAFIRLAVPSAQARVALRKLLLNSFSSDMCNTAWLESTRALSSLPTMMISTPVGEGEEEEVKHVEEVQNYREAEEEEGGEEKAVRDALAAVTLAGARMATCIVSGGANIDTTCCTTTTSAGGTTVCNLEKKPVGNSIYTDHTNDATLGLRLLLLLDGAWCLPGEGRDVVLESDPVDSFARSNDNMDPNPGPVVFALKGQEALKARRRRIAHKRRPSDDDFLSRLLAMDKGYTVVEIPATMPHHGGFYAHNPETGAWQKLE